MSSARLHSRILLASQVVWEAACAAAAVLQAVAGVAQTVAKAIRQGIESEVRARKTAAEAIHASEEQLDQGEIVKLLEEEMMQAAKNLEF